MAQPHADAAGEPGVVYIPVSWGELIDGITILELKAERFRDGDKVAKVRRASSRRCAPCATAASRRSRRSTRPPAGVNLALWEVEQALRSLEREGRFDAEFLELARSVSTS